MTLEEKGSSRDHPLGTPELVRRSKCPEKKDFLSEIKFDMCVHVLLECKWDRTWLDPLFLLQSLALVVMTLDVFATKHPWYTYRPSSQEVDQEVATETCWEHLGNDVEIGDQGRLKDDGDVGGVEQFDGVSVVLTTVACWLDGQIHPEALVK